MSVRIQDIQYETSQQNSTFTCIQKHSRYACSHWCEYGGRVIVTFLENATNEEDREKKTSCPWLRYKSGKCWGLHIYIRAIQYTDTHAHTDSLYNIFVNDGYVCIFYTDTSLYIHLHIPICISPHTHLYIYIHTTLHTTHPCPYHSLLFLCVSLRPPPPRVICPHT